MFDFFKKNKPSIDNHALELISIHIPKTAGTSFRNSLKKAYGEENVVRFDINAESKTVRLNNDIYTDQQLPSGVKVLHGHFSYQDLRSAFSFDANVALITWLRHPVDRVISNYYYLCKRLAEELQEEEKGLNILSKLQRSLLEYARWEKSRNRISRFLSGTELSDFTFIGIQEYYSEDLIDLSRCLGWPEVEEFHHNYTGSKYHVDEATRAEIASLNEKDIILYEEALKLRASRKNKS